MLVQSCFGASPLSLPLAQLVADLPEQQEALFPLPASAVFEEPQAASDLPEQQEDFPLLAVFLESPVQEDFAVFVAVLEAVWPFVAFPPKATFLVDELASFFASTT